MTIHLEFTSEQITEMRYQRYNHLVPLVQRRMEALLLKAYNLSPEQIEEIVGVSGNTIREYYELYQQGGIEKLRKSTTINLKASWSGILYRWRRIFEKIRQPVSRKPKRKLKRSRV